MTSRVDDSLIKDLSHHGYLLQGDSNTIQSVATILEESGISTNDNPDYFAKHYPAFTIDDSREIKSLSSTRPSAEGGKRIFIISFDSATQEAQNALLKLLEEPVPGSHFFVIAPSASILLPTVKSRLLYVILNSDNGSNGEFGELAKEFLESSPSKRIELVKDMLEEVTKEKRPKRDLIRFVEEVEKSLSGDVIKNMAMLDKLAFIRKYLYDRSPSLKMLLEYLSI